MKRNAPLLVVIGALALAPVAVGDEGHPGHDHGPAATETLGSVEFPVSCKAAARARFGRAVALLHSFWYDEAEKAFAEVTQLDPKCAMGHWGVAMSLFHPIWAAGNPGAAPTKAELTRGVAAAARAKAIGAKTERERDYIAAVGAYYQDADTLDHAARALAFEKGMAEVYRKNPKDREAAAFYALAILGTADPKDKTYAKQKQAADLLNTILPGAPDHPGVAHYLIHSFDYPGLAPLALPAARAYSHIAASSPHALHMPSHIFTRLALWDESIQSNLASADAARRHVAKTKPGASSFDQLHALDYLEYAYLQEGQDQKARGVLDEVRSVVALDVPNFAAAYSLAAVPARYALERHRWAEAAALEVRPAAFPWDRFRNAEALTQFARAVGGARGGELGVAHAAAERLAAIQAALVAAKDAYWADQVEIQQLAVAGWIARAEKHDGEALEKLRAAAAREDATDKHPVTPGVLLPAREQLADLLLDLGHFEDAVEEYETSLKTAPGRYNSVRGAWMAATKAGDPEKAGAFERQLKELTAHADGTRSEAEAGLR